MEELSSVPEEFIEPILPCLHLLQNVNIHVYETVKPIWKRCYYIFFNECSVLAFFASLTMNLETVFKGELRVDVLSYVVSGYMLNIQAIYKATVVELNKKELRSIIREMGSMWRTEDLTEVQINKKNVQLKGLKLCYAAMLITSILLFPAFSASLTSFIRPSFPNTPLYSVATLATMDGLRSSYFIIHGFCWSYLGHKTYYWINIIATWQYMLAPLMETIFRKYILQQEWALLLPFSCSFPFDSTGNWGIYIAVYIFESYCMFRIVYYYIGTEFLMITLCSNLATEFTLLQEDLLNIKPGKNLAALKILIANHQKLISLSEQLDDVFNKVIFVNLTSASIPICLCGFSAKVAHGALEITKNYAAVVCLILPLFNLCYYAERLAEASAGIADSVYHNLWYQGDIRFQKVVWFVMRRSQKPCCLTSLKYSPIALTTFTAVLSTTWSYFSLASSLYEG